MPTFRLFKRQAFQSSLYEAQDILCDVDQVDMIPLSPGRWFDWRSYWHRRLMWHDPTKFLFRANPGLVPAKLEKDYDVFLVVCQDWRDAFYANAVQGWKDRCRISICYIDEIWASAVPICEYVLQILGMFDYVILGHRLTVDPLSKVIGKSCHFVPGAVDALRFSPGARPPKKAIDVYSIGRRNERVHNALLKVAAEKDLFYLYDTASEESSKSLLNHRDHRRHFANVARRSRCFMVAPAKVDDREATGGQIEVGFRYYEGAAAGAALLGEGPKCAAFDELFDWPDAVVPVDHDAPDVEDALREILSDPERLERVGQRNAAEALVRHDWVHRWRDMLQIAGVQPMDAMRSRLNRLDELSNAIRNNSDSLG